LPVPASLRDTHYAGAERLGHGKGYQYPHDFPGHIVAQDYLGATRLFYHPSDQGRERQIRERLEQWRAILAQAKTPP
jgi:putative ATPase